METNTRTCKECGNEYQHGVGYRFGHYCSRMCKNHGYVKKIKERAVLGQLPLIETKPEPKQPTPPMQNTEPVQKPVNFTLPGHIEPTAQFLITFITKDRDRFEELYKQERATRQKIRNEKDSLEKEFEKYKYQQELEKIASAKPSGLQGLSENPLVSKLVDHIGPALGKLAERLVDQPNLPAPTQLAGDQNPAVHFAQWLESKQPELQQYIIEMLATLSRVPDNNLFEKVAQINNLVLGDYMRATG